MGCLSRACWAGWSRNTCRARGALRWLVGIPGAWLFIEWWRSWFLSGFGWLALGYAHTDNWLGEPGAGGRAVRSRPAHVAARGRAADAAARRPSASASPAARCSSSSGARRSRCAASNGRSPTAGRSPWPWCRARFRRTRSGSPKISSPSSTCTRRSRARRMAPKLIVWPESAIPDLANNHIELLPRRLPGGERARFVAR